jgi:hypothetical protein
MFMRLRMIGMPPNLRHTTANPLSSNFLPYDIIMVSGLIAMCMESRDSYGLDDSGSIPAGARDFSLLHNVQTGSGARYRWIFLLG